MSIPIFVLIHSPFVGPYTWSLAAEELKRRSFEVFTPSLENPRIPLQTYWEQHVESITTSLGEVSGQDPLFLVGHSGAGPLLPAIRKKLAHPVAAYIFVDAVLPEDGKNRLDLFENSQAADRFRGRAQEGFLPAWREEDIQEIIPDEQIRRRFVSELLPVPLQVYEEPIPVFEGWPDAPCGYLKFGANPAYEPAWQRAVREGYSTARLEGGHFHMLVEPGAVVDELLVLRRKMGV